MTAFWANWRTRPSAKPGSFAWATVVCLILLALLAVVQVAHTHPLESDADHCPLCVVLHAATPVAVAAVTVILIPMGVPAPAAQAREIVRSWHPKLFTRPPPISC